VVVADDGRERVDVVLALHQGPEDLQAGVVREQREGTGKNRVVDIPTPR
jgi:hypothetical protein